MNAFPSNASMLEYNVLSVTLWTDVQTQVPQKSFIQSKMEPNFESIEYSKTKVNRHVSCVTPTPLAIMSDTQRSKLHAKLFEK